MDFVNEPGAGGVFGADAVCTQEVWIEALAGLSIRTRWQPARHGPGQPGGNMATKPNAHAWRQIVGGPVP